MPRLARPSLKNRSKGVNSRSTQTKTPEPAYAQYMVTIKSCIGTGYVEKMMSQSKSCTFAEYYTVDNVDGTHALFAYVQFRRAVTLRNVSEKFPVTAVIKNITIAEKIVSGFHAMPDKKTFGVERDVPKPLSLVDNTPFVPVNVVVEFKLQPVSKPAGNLWNLLPGPKKIDFKALLARCEPATNKGPPS